MAEDNDDNEDFECFTEDCLVDEIIIETIDYIWETLNKKIDDNEFSKFEIPYATQICMLKIKKMVELATLPHDGVFSLGSNALENFDLDEEPVPSKIDTWARGTGFFLF
jgi:hypothetical protein